MLFCGNSTFWDEDLTVNSSWPHFTQCFQSTVLVYIPASFLWISSAFYIPYLLSRDTSIPGPFSALYITKTSLSIVMAVFTVCMVVNETFIQPNESPDVINGPTYSTPSIWVARLVEILSFTLTGVIVHLERKSCIVTSGVLFVYWLLFLVCDVVPLYTYVMMQIYKDDLFRFIGMVAILTFATSQLVLNSIVDMQLSTISGLVSTNYCPEASSSFLSRITFSWITKLMTTGCKRALTSADLWQLNPQDSCETVVSRFTRSWLMFYKSSRSNKTGRSTTHSCFVKANSNHGSTLVEQIHFKKTRIYGSVPSCISNERTPLLKWFKQKSLKHQEVLKKPGQTHRKCNLLKVLSFAFGFEVIISYICKAISDVLQFVWPFLLRGLILNIQSSSEHSKWQGFVLATAILFGSWMQTIFYHQHYHLAIKSGMRMQSALMVAIYKKALSLNFYRKKSSAKREEVVSLTLVDCQKVQDLITYIWMVWSIPLQIILAMLSLWYVLGLPAMVGLGLMMLLVPLNCIMASRKQRLQSQNFLWKDQRLNMVKEVLSSIKVLKLYAWEETFQNKINKFRQKEMRILRKLACLNGLLLSVWISAPYLACLVSFGTYLASDLSLILTPDMVFVTIALFNIIQFPVSFIPEMIALITQAVSSVRRIEDFLCQSEIDKSHYDRLGTKDCAVSIKKGIFSWNSKDNFRLSGINLEIQHGSFVAVVGSSESGKSSLLSAILGETTCHQGHVSTLNHISYVPQKSYIQDCSLEENILFGASMDFKRYNKVIEACALRPELGNTEMDEEVLNLNCDQEKKVCLARALYSNADLYILDDPLRDLDPQDDKHIYQKVLSHKGLMKNRTRIMSTNSIHWLPLVDVIVVMQDGRISEMGSYLELMKTRGHLAQYLFNILRDDLQSKAVEDDDVQQMRNKMWEHVKAVKSHSEDIAVEEVINCCRTRFEMMSSGCGSPPDKKEEKKTCRLTSMESISGQSHRLTKMVTMDSHNISFSAYLSYIGNVGVSWTFFIFIIFLFHQVSGLLTNIWLTKWTSDPRFIFKSDNFTSLDMVDANSYYLNWYGALGIAQVLFVVTFACLGSLRLVKTADTMHATMLDHILKAPLNFFDTTSTSQMVKHFDHDIEVLDTHLPSVVFMFITCGFSVFTIVVIISINAPLCISVILPLCIAYFILQKCFVSTNHQLKKLDAAMKAPLNTHISETLAGIHIIRAFDVASRFCQTFKELVDRSQVFYFAAVTSNRWLGVWVEVVSSLVVFFTIIFSLLTPNVNGALIGLSVTYAMQISQALKWLVRSSSDMKSNVTCVASVNKYRDISQEVSHHNNVRLPPDWPSRGEVIINQYSASYNQASEPELRQITCHIKPGEKIGIVGKPESGKLSFTMALLRMLNYLEGEIIIDNINISVIGLNDLRSKLTIVPQEGVLLSGTLRMNLDPKGQYLDQELWSALNLSHLKDMVSILPAGLETHVGEHGLKLSPGQRRLLCLARAILQHSKVVIMEEPNCSDEETTDSLVLNTLLHGALRNCTIIIIAQTINTMMECDRIMVLECGEIIELSTPQCLLQQENSYFFKLINSSNPIVYSNKKTAISSS
ncbi:multidrug resistance-associated protein 1 [Biomphalaria glabrata]